MSRVRRNIGARNLLEGALILGICWETYSAGVKCLDPCHKPVGGQEGSRCPPSNHCGCNGQRQCSSSGYCFGSAGRCIENQKTFIEEGDGQVVISVFTGFSCCNATLDQVRRRGTEQKANSLERCLMLCTAAQWCAAVEWSPSEVLNCFLMIHPDSRNDLDGLFDSTSKTSKKMCMRTSWNSTLTSGGVATSTSVDVDAYEATDVTVCGVNMTLAREQSNEGGQGGVPVYGASVDECEAGEYLCTKDNLAVCLPQQVAMQFQAQHKWNCTEVETKTTTTTMVIHVEVAVDSGGFVGGSAFWILLVLLVLCVLGMLLFCLRRQRRKRAALHMLPTSSDLQRRSTSKSSLFSKRSMNNLSLYLKTGSTFSLSGSKMDSSRDSIKDVSPKFSRRDTWSSNSATTSPTRSSKVGGGNCGFAGNAPLRGGWGQGAERPGSRVGSAVKPGSATSPQGQVWAVSMPAFAGLRGAANAQHKEKMGVSYTYTYGATPSAPTTPGAAPKHRDPTSPPGSSRSSRSAPAAVPPVDDPPRPNTANRAAVAVGTFVAEFSASWSQLRNTLNSRSGLRERPGSSGFSFGSSFGSSLGSSFGTGGAFDQRPASGFGARPATTGSQEQREEQPKQEPQGKRDSRASTADPGVRPGTRRAHSADVGDWEDDPDEESTEEQPPRRSQSSPGGPRATAHRGSEGRRASKGGKRTSETPVPATLRFADLTIDASSPEIADAMLERKVDKLLWRLRSMTPKRHRNRVFLEQCRAWHPDKNTGDERLATVAFQRLQASRAWFLSDVDTDKAFVVPAR